MESIFEQGYVVYEGYVDDRRNTDNAFIFTTAIHFHCETPEQAKALVLQEGSDAAGVKWLELDENNPDFANLYANHKVMVQVAFSRLVARRAVSLDFFRAFLDLQRDEFGLTDDDPHNSYTAVYHQSVDVVGKGHGEEGGSPDLLVQGAEYAIAELTKSSGLDLVSLLSSELPEGKALLAKIKDRMPKSARDKPWYGRADTFVSYAWSTGLRTVYAALDNERSRKVFQHKRGAAGTASQGNAAASASFFAWFDVLAIRQLTTADKLSGMATLTPMELERVDVIINEAGTTSVVLEPLFSDEGRDSRGPHEALVLVRDWQHGAQ